MGARNTKRKSAPVFSAQARQMCENGPPPGLDFHGIRVCESCERPDCDGRCDAPAMRRAA